MTPGEAGGEDQLLCGSRKERQKQTTKTKLPRKIKDVPCRKKVPDFSRCWPALEGVNTGRAAFLLCSSGR